MLLASSAIEPAGEGTTGSASWRDASSVERPVPVAPARPVNLTGDLLIRCAGLLGFGLSVIAGRWLHHLLPAGRLVNPTIGQFALAAIMFVSASLGSGLLVLGGHIHDHIEVAERWRRRW